MAVWTRRNATELPIWSILNRLESVLNSPSASHQGDRFCPLCTSAPRAALSVATNISDLPGNFAAGNIDFKQTHVIVEDRALS